MSTTPSSLCVVPLFAEPPPPGHAVEVAPGVLWFSTPLPFRLRAVNHWLIRDDDGWTLIDCGFPLPEVQEQIETTWLRVLGGLPITRLIVTHHHPDHVGNCRWICERWGILPSMTAAAYAHAEKIFGEQWPEEGARRLAFWVRHGLSSTAAEEINKGWNEHRAFSSSLPETYRRLNDGEVIRIGGDEWQVILAHGHAPEQALLHMPQRNLLIAADQVLPKISPNISVVDEDSTPLALFLESNRRIAETCGDVIVLPGHETPFSGLHARLKGLEMHHQRRLATIEAALKLKPQSAADLVPLLFGKVPAFEMGLAIGEAIAHLHHLVAQKRARCTSQNEVELFAPA